MNIFETLYKASVTSQELSNLSGRVLGLALGIVSSTDDPEQLARIRIWEPAKGAKVESNWLYRVQPMSFLSTPLPLVGHTVAVGYIDGNPHEGIYLGTLQNLINPSGSPEELVLTVGDTRLVVRSGAIEVTGVTSLTVNGKEITTLGAKDTRSDTLVTKGW